MLKVSVVRNRTIRKFLASFISSSLAVSMMSFTAFADGEKTGKPVYDRDYTYQNILTDYIYFAENDLTALSHQVGAFACGGDLKWGNGGQGQSVASYANNIVQFGASEGDLGAWIKNDDLKDKNIFAGNYEGGLSFIQENDNFIDMSKAFKALEAQSNALTNSADYVVSEDDVVIQNVPWIPVPEIAININIDKFDGKNIKIPASLLDGVSYINITNNENNISMEDLAREGYVITFDDVTNIDLVFTETCDPQSHTNPVYFSVNADLNNLSPYDQMRNRFGGKGLAGNFKNIDRATELAADDAQINLKGMNLLFNFPDAEDIRLTLFEGHILAPNATVHVEGGNFEGGIIAENIDNSLGAEGHYYPFNTPETHDYPLVDPDDTTDPDDGNGGSTTDPDDGNGGSTTDPDDGN
ncbi:MAG: choice-of-anchor A family protein, partial [Clostridia bacterium]|nr:choice-of-anchor A family protein [Clostridia bacterium]